MDLKDEWFSIQSRVLEIQGQSRPVTQFVQIFKRTSDAGVHFLLWQETSTDCAL
jgi:hypothetical protein